MRKQLTDKQKIKNNINYYLRGQSNIPHEVLFTEGYFNFINGEVVPTPKALKLRSDVPYDKTIKVTRVKLMGSTNSSCTDVLLVDIEKNACKGYITFGSVEVSGYYSSSIDDKDKEPIQMNYEEFAKDVLAWIRDNKYVSNIKNSAGIKNYIERNDKTRFTWLKWLIKELGIHDYQFSDKHLFKARPNLETDALAVQRIGMNHKMFALMFPPAVMHKYYKNVCRFNIIVKSDDLLRLEPYNAKNPGAYIWTPYPAYKGTDYDRTEMTTSFYSLIENNMCQVIDGVVTYTPATLKFIEEWENNFRNIIKENTSNWRQDSYTRKYTPYSWNDRNVSIKEGEEEEHEIEYGIGYLLPQYRFSRVLVHTEYTCQFNVILMAKELGVLDELYQGLAKVTHIQQMMDIVAISLKDLSATSDDGLTDVKMSHRDALAGILDHIEKYVKV